MDGELTCVIMRWDKPLGELDSPDSRSSKLKWEGTMKATQELHNFGQSLWLDNITRDLLDDGTMKRYIDEFSITGLTSNPTIFEHAISRSKSYDAEIERLLRAGLSGELLFFELALQDLTRAADLFASIHQRTAGVDGFVSLEISPLLAYESQESIAAELQQHAGQQHAPRRRRLRMGKRQPGVERKQRHFDREPGKQR